jgi:uncharacterized membrane protein SpoIIM required for sporulation/uncharacterized RDD family membrane protein YckC
MADTRAPTLPEFSRHLAIETPEHVVLEFELAGLGSRAAATVVDLAIIATLYLLIAIFLGITRVAGAVLSGWITALAIALGFLLTWGYFAVFEALNAGQTPGKRHLGIRVVMDTGHPLTFPGALIRNLIRLVDLQPGISSLVGIACALFHPHNKRLGDLVAGTIVVRDRADDLVLTGRGLRDRHETDQETVDAGEPKLTDEEYRLLEQLVNRLDSLESARRDQLVTVLATRFAPRFPARDPRPDMFLVDLYTSERRIRQSRFATRRASDAGRGQTLATAESFVARRQQSWETFRRLAAETQARGLISLGGDEVVAFAARYREVAADLARARTYGVDPRVSEYLERIVSAGHNTLYGARGTRRAVRRLGWLRELPGAVYQARVYVLIAFLLFAAPAVVGYVLIRERPTTAYEVLPDVAIARAESGASRIAAGRGYAEAPSPFLPIVASGIIANNLQVAFGAFALGITAGVGTTIVLVFNGLFFGAVLGMFANNGLAAWLLTFVAAHGVLELTAIFIAGAAGLLIGRAVVAPGDLTRRDAVVRKGQLAIKLVGASAFMLLLAGIIEGFLSASDAAPAFKYAASGASLALIALFLIHGRQTMERRNVEEPAGQGR